MRVPKDVFAMIISYLPADKVFELWCTGRELHEMKYYRNIYNKMILPHLKVLQMNKFNEFVTTNNNEFNILFKGSLEKYGVFKWVKEHHFYHVKYKTKYIFIEWYRYVGSFNFIFDCKITHKNNIKRIKIEFSVFKIEYRSNLIVFHLNKI
jgi:hypothetical protein